MIRIQLGPVRKHSRADVGRYEQSTRQFWKELLRKLQVLS